MKFIQLYNLLKEDIVGNTGFVYHRTKKNPEQYSIWDVGIDPKQNNSAMYGKGLYCTYSFTSQEGSNGDDMDMSDRYGNYIIRGKVDFSNFFIFSKSLFSKVRPNENYLDQYKKYKLLNDPKAVAAAQQQDQNPNEYSSHLALGLWTLVKRKGVSGIAFTGHHDGDVVAIYNKNAFIPQGYSDDNGKTWKPVPANISNIKSADPNANSINSYEIKNNIPKTIFKRVLQEYRQNKALSVQSVQLFMKNCVVVNQGQGHEQQRLAPNQYSIFKDGSVNIDVGQDNSIGFDTNSVYDIIPVKFNFVHGSYRTPQNIQNLTNSPNRIKGNMYISSNITSLKGCSTEILGDFHLIDTAITTLDGAPDKISGNFHCSNNKNLQSLNGISGYIGGGFHISDCPALRDASALLKSNIGQNKAALTHGGKVSFLRTPLDYNMKDQLIKAGLLNNTQ